VRTNRQNNNNNMNANMAKLALWKHGRTQIRHMTLTLTKHYLEKSKKYFPIPCQYKEGRKEKHQNAEDATMARL